MDKDSKLITESYLSKIANKVVDTIFPFTPPKPEELAHSFPEKEFRHFQQHGWEVTKSIAPQTLGEPIRAELEKKYGGSDPLAKKFTMHYLKDAPEKYSLQITSYGPRIGGYGIFDSEKDTYKTFEDAIDRVKEEIGRYGVSY